MSNGKLLLFIIAILPILSWFTLRFFKHSQGFYNFCYRLFPILYLINVFQGADYFAKSFNVFTISESIRGVSLALYADKISILFLFLIGFILLLFAFYSKKFFEVISDKNADYFKEFFVLIVSFLNLLILSKNLFTILFFYICLIVSSHFFGIKYFHKVENKLTKSFTFLLYFESFFFFLALVATSKFMKGSTIEDLTREQGVILFILYFFGLFFSVLMPYFIFFRKPNIEPIITYAFFFLAYRENI